MSFKPKIQIQQVKYNSFLQLILIRYLEFIREPGIIFWSIVFPIAMVWILGIAFTHRGDVTQTIAWVNRNNENELFNEFLKDAGRKKNRHNHIFYSKDVEYNKSGKTNFQFIPVHWDSALLMLKKGQTNIILENDHDSIYFHFDPENPDAKLAYIILTTAIHNRETIDGATVIKPMTRTGTRYIDFLVPGIIAMGVMNSILWGMSYGLIDMRVKKLLRRMVATPMNKTHFLLSHFIARLSMSTVEALILFLFCSIYFNISIQGSVIAVIIMFLTGNFAFSGIAILIASRISDTRVGNGVINAVILPMTILSGIFFSYHNFPEKFVPVIKTFPLTMFADGLRSIFIEGAGIYDVSLQVLSLCIIGTVTFYFGLRYYKWY